MIAIGLTGGIASGKSLVSAMLAEKGVPVIEADKVGHQAYRRGTEAYRLVVEAFGAEVVVRDGEIDRKALGARVFGDGQARRRLEAIVWPAMRDMMEQRLGELRDRDMPVAVLEAAVLVEADWTPLVDEVWVVVVPEEVARERLVRRNGLVPEEATARIRAQLSNEERVRHADAVIDNSGSLEALRDQVERAWGDLKARLPASESGQGV
jgi:dephospho-CoA kinase